MWDVAAPGCQPASLAGPSASLTTLLGSATASTSMSFVSRKMRAIGERLWIDPNIGFIHYGIKGWEGNFHQSILKPPEEIKQILEERAAIASVHAAMAGNGAAVS